MYGACQTPALPLPPLAEGPQEGVLASPLSCASAREGRGRVRPRHRPTPFVTFGMLSVYGLLWRPVVLGAVQARDAWGCVHVAAPKPFEEIFVCRSVACSGVL